MTVVRNILLGPDGAPLANQAVGIRLATNGFKTAASSEVLSLSKVVVTDATGLYSADLTPQSQIDPLGTHYEVTHPNEILSFVVSDAAGPLWIRNLLVSNPAVPSPVLVGVQKIDSVAPDGVGNINLSGTYARVIGLGASNGTDDTTALNALLATAGGKIARGTPGENYQISAPLIIPSGVTLDMTNCTVTLKSGSNCNLLNNAALTAQRAVADGAITSGTNTLTSATAAFTSADTGRTAVVSGALLGGYVLVATMTYVNATTVTLSLNAGATVSGAAVSFYNRDSNIVVVGGTWDRGANGPVSGSVACHTLRFRHVDGLVLRNLAVKSMNGKYVINPGDCTNVLVENISANVTSSPFQANGPIDGCIVRNIYGVSTDDFVAFTPNDWTQYADTCGDITNVLVENVRAVAGAACVKVLGGSPGTAARAVRVRNVSGSANNNAIFIGDDTAQASTTGGLVDDLDIENVSATVPNAQSIVYMTNSNASRIRLARIAFNNATATAAAIRYVPLNAAVLDTLIVDGLPIRNMGAGPAIQIDSNGTVTRLVVDKLTIGSCLTGATGVLVKGVVTDVAFRGADITGTGSTYILSLNGSDPGATVTRASFTDTHMIGGGGLITATASTHTLPNVEVAAATLSATAWLVDLNTTTELHLVGVTLKSPSQGIANLRANSVVTFAGDGCALAAGGQNIKVTAGGKAVVRAWDIPPSTTVGGFPTIAAGAGAGTGPTVTVAGTDRAGTVTVVVGTTPAAGVLATVTFIGTWPQAPKVSLTPTLTAASQAAGAYVSAKTTTTFVISCANAPSGTVTFDYVIAD